MSRHNNEEIRFSPASADTPFCGSAFAVNRKRAVGSTLPTVRTVPVAKATNNEAVLSRDGPVDKSPKRPILMV